MDRNVKDSAGLNSSSSSSRSDGFASVSSINGEKQHMIQTFDSPLMLIAKMLHVYLLFDSEAAGMFGRMDKFRSSRPTFSSKCFG